MIENNQATGISFGLEPLMLLSPLKLNMEKYLIVSLDQDKKAIELARKLRAKGKIVSMFYGKPSKALDYANSYRIKKVIFVGKKEVEKKKYMVKDMQSGKEILLTIEKKK